MSSDQGRLADGRIQEDAQMQAHSRGELRPKTKLKKLEEVLNRYPPPAHWKPSRRSGQAIFNLLCITSFGHAGLDPIWAAMKLEEEGDESAWVEGVRQGVDRMNNMLIVVRPHSFFEGICLADFDQGGLAAGHFSRLHHHSAT